MANISIDLAGHRPLSLAVSGGADSFAMLGLLHQQGHDDFDVQSVDHGLRPQAADEVNAVADWCAARNISHVIHQWNGKHATGNVMAAARLARYRLLADHAAGRGADLAVAHQADDVAESLFMRLQRGVGLYGLDPLPAERWLETQNGQQVRLMRPLLHVSRAELRAIAQQMKLPFVDDPTNEDEAFERIAARRVLTNDPALRHRLLALTPALANLKRQMRQTLALDWTDVVRQAPGDLVQINRAVFKALPTALQFEVLAQIVGGFNRGAALPRGPRLVRLAQSLCDPSFEGASLAGLLFVAANGNVLVGREARACAPALPLAKQPRIWDRRYRVSGPAHFSVGALGAAGLAQLKQRGVDLSAVPPVLRAGLAGVWLDDELIACPAFEAVPDGVRWGRTLWLTPASPPIALY